MHRAIVTRGGVLGWLLLLPTLVGFGQEFRFPEATHQKAELKYVSGIPLLRVEGTPEEMGQQEAALTAGGARGLVEYPRELLKRIGLEGRLQALLDVAGTLTPQIPKDHLAELEAFARASGIDRQLLLGANTMTDCYRGAFGCSSLLVDPPRSKTGGPLVARNLDFYDLGYLHRYSLVTVYRPKDKHAFASIGFAGVLGCLSGMNDAGLGLAVHEVFLSRDGAPLFNPRGTPYTLLFRRILEECTTIAEAEKLLRGAERTTMFNLALCDRSGVAVVEATPKSVVTRRGENGLCACTNHFRSPDLATILISLRYRTLMQYQNYPKLDLADLTGALKRVAHPRMTIHAMIFEPATLRAHVALGRPPATDLPLQPLELGPLFAGKPLAEAAPAKTENKK